MLKVISEEELDSLREFALEDLKKKWTGDVQNTSFEDVIAEDDELPEDWGDDLV